MKPKIMILSVMMTAMMICPAHAAPLGCVDTQKVLSGYEKMKNAQEHFKKLEQSIQEEIAVRQKEIERAREKGASNADIQSMIDKIEKELEPRSRNLRESKQKTMFEIQNDVIQASEKIAKKTGIDAVLNKQVFVTGCVDITDKVIELLNKK